MSDSNPLAVVNAAETASVAAGPAFLLKETINVIIGKQNANLYPEYHNRCGPSKSEPTPITLRQPLSTLEGLYLSSD
jgi:hypothetical protein